MTMPPLSLLALTAQALPMGPAGMAVTAAEVIAVACALLGVLVVAIWVRWRGKGY